MASRVHYRTRHGAVLQDLGALRRAPSRRPPFVARPDPGPLRAQAKDYRRPLQGPVSVIMCPERECCDPRPHSGPQTHRLASGFWVCGLAEWCKRCGLCQRARCTRDAPLGWGLAGSGQTLRISLRIAANIAGQFAHILWHVRRYIVDDGDGNDDDADDDGGGGGGCWW